MFASKQDSFIDKTHGCVTLPPSVVAVRKFKAGLMRPLRMSPFPSADSNFLVAT
jgi:hypothetical protein